MQIQLPDFSQGHVLVVGDVMLDRYWQGATARISPEAPVPVVHVDQIEERPGGAANVAFNLASLGSRVALAGAVGGDEAGVILERTLGQHGIESLLQRVEAVPTITKLRVISRHQQLIRLDFEQNFGAVDLSALEARCLERLSGCQVLLLSDYAKGTLQHPQPLIKAARAAGIPVLIDPKGQDFERYSGATLLTPNLAEFEAVVGHCASDRVLVERGEQLRDRLQLDALLITLGERGMLLLSHDEQAVHLPTHAREVFDVTGAGDTVIAVLAVAIATGMALVDAAGLANLAAGVVVAKLGAGSVTLAELRRLLRRQESWSPVINREQLRVLLEEARSCGERIVMTNGCFDILHEGHVAYLQEARSLGDRLLVAVNDDDSVRRLKGEGRPINALRQRMAVLAGLASVDWVVPFSEDTPERLICDVKPDLLVKGGDYRPDQIAGYACVTANGGEVRVLSYLDGQSTSRIVQSIRAGQEGE
ncbi:MAG: bifunctional D-glycero-beta-D-manno-heptose-7-phosphate kinase/D-glycero-beta-D-manno-heptose 1-phosphate adenylyltransferase HldE [Gammaproteobacteria bacterium]|nr:bifunctional D-glycero-beta-D-manno-heptose-7-phosphate kinase/D-glycero-beta-D-manno-heptose 1-phosphate adenylyltransferase HldE [Gammaproteobacteria bacterium]